jgi:hypothetical protein
VDVFEEFGCAVGGFDDDPLVVGAAEGLALDDLAGEAESFQVGNRFFDREAAPDTQFHQYWRSVRIPNVRYSSD